MIPIYYDYIETHEESFLEDIRNGKPISIIETCRPKTLAEQVSHLQIPDLRQCHINANTLSFNCANGRNVKYLIAYKSNKNFNIEPPKLAPHITCPIDLFRGYDQGRYDELSSYFYSCIYLLPNGYSIEHIRPYTRHINDTVPNFVRLSWFMPSHLLADQIPVHPEYHRPLTTDEHIKIFADTCYQWLQRQAELYLADAWGAADYETNYDNESKTFVGRNLTGDEPIKHFDIYDYLPPYRKFPASHEPYRYNIDSDNNLIRPWNDIEQAYHEYQESKVKNVPVSE